MACWALKVPAYKKSDDRPKELEETKTKFKGERLVLGGREARPPSTLHRSSDQVHTPPSNRAESLYKAEAQAVLTFFLLLVVTHHKWVGGWLVGLPLL